MSGFGRERVEELAGKELGLYAKEEGKLVRAGRRKGGKRRERGGWDERGKRSRRGASARRI